MPFVPYAQSFAAEAAERGPAVQVGLGSEGIVDRGVGGEEALG